MVKRKPLDFGRLALIAAAAVAIIVIAVRYRSHPAAPEAAASPPPAGDIAQMIPQIEAKLRQNPDDATGWRMLAMAQFNVARFPQAARSYARAAALSPKDAELWSSLGESLIYARRDGVDADAARAFERARALDPKEPRARYFLAVRQDIAGDHRGAVEAWLALLRDTPPGAPWEQSVRKLVTEVAAREKIDIAGRLPAAPSHGDMPAGPSGAGVARSGIAGPTAADMAGAQRMSPSEQDAMAHAMVDRLARRLAADPRDADGWIRLMRARLVLGDRAAALAARADAERTFAGDPGTRARIAEAAGTLGL